LVLVVARFNSWDHFFFQSLGSGVSVRLRLGLPKNHVFFKHRMRITFCKYATWSYLSKSNGYSSSSDLKLHCCHRLLCRNHQIYKKNSLDLKKIIRFAIFALKFAVLLEMIWLFTDFLKVF